MRRLVRVSLGLLAVNLAVAADRVVARQAPLDYPQWRGLTRDGSASGFIEPAVWPPSLTQRWKVTVGEGYATPVLAGQRVYVFTRSKESEVLTALNVQTGTVEWSSVYQAPFAPSPPAAAHGAGPKATPLVHNGRIFTQGIGGVVSGFDAVTGTRLWQTAPPAEPPYFSAASSPVGEGDLVIVHPGNYEPLTAFAAATGAVRWTVGSGGFFASPIVVDLAGTRQVITVTQDSLIGVSLDGRLLWQYPWAGGGGSTTPVAVDGIVVVSGLDQGVTAVRPTLGIEGWRVERVWSTTDVSMYVSDPVAVGTTLYGLSHRARGQYFALDLGTGRTLWLGSPREAEHTAVVKGGRVLFLLNDDAELMVTRANPTGFALRARYTVADSATWAQPAISGNRVFVKDTRSLALWTID